MARDLSETTRYFYVANYPAEGQHVAAETAEFLTLGDARDEVRHRLGDLADWRKWDGIAEDGDVEAYHASRRIGCGGVAISKE